MKRSRDENSQADINGNTKKCKVILDRNSVNNVRRNSKTVLCTKNVSILFDPRKLRQALLPTLTKIDSNEMPKSFCIDLFAIKSKLISEKYSEPWKFIEEVWLMFNNIWQSTLKTTSVYKSCVKSSEEFDHEIDSVMQSLGYCCGKMYKYDPQPLCCSVQDDCTILIGASYYTYQTGNVGQLKCICEKCFTDSHGNTITLEDETLTKRTKVKKNQFIQNTNNISIPEPFIECQKCGRLQHQICVLYLESNWPDGFVCDVCLPTNGIQQKVNRFRAKNLPVTQLDRHIETRVNNFLSQNKVNCGKVDIRMLFNSDSSVKVLPETRKLFVDLGGTSGQFPYKNKAIFAFQEINGADVCIFGMYTQEYGSECASPNTRRVYITSLDSVNFFQPKSYRTAVYHEIFLGYMDYVKKLGYEWVHIWACPPPLDENYIFFRHPSDQKNPGYARLQAWYKKILRNGKREGIIVEYKSLLQQCKEDKVTSADQLPYFDDDHWPLFIEENIKKIQTEVKEASEQKKTRKSSMEVSRNAGNVDQQRKCLDSNLFTSMVEHENLFFSVRLQHTVGSALNRIRDPDSPLDTAIMNSHCAIFDFSRDNNYEFSSLRRAQFSTLRIIYELHCNQHQLFGYICNSCGMGVMGRRYHCNACDDYDLCVNCYNSIGHDHEMDGIGLDMTPANRNQANSKTPDQSITSLLQLFGHAWSCIDLRCPTPSCGKMKRTVLHVKFCKKIHEDCQTCRKFNAIFSCHSQSCQNVDCSYPLCRDEHIQSQQQKRQQEEKKLQDERMVNIANSLMKIAVNILDHRESSKTQQQNILNASVIDIARVQQTLLQEMKHMLHDDVVSQIRNDVNVDSTVPGQCGQGS